MSESRLSNAERNSKSSVTQHLVAGILQLDGLRTSQLRVRERA